MLSSISQKLPDGWSPGARTIINMMNRQRNPGYRVHRKKKPAMISRLLNSSLKIVVSTGNPGF